MKLVHSPQPAHMGMVMRAYAHNNLPAAPQDFLNGSDISDFADAAFATRTILYGRFIGAGNWKNVTYGTRLGQVLSFMIFSSMQALIYLLYSKLLDGILQKSV